MWPSALEGFPETQCFQQPLHGWQEGCPSHRDQRFIIAVLISWDSAQGRDASEWYALIDLTSTAQSLVSTFFCSWEGRILQEGQDEPIISHLGIDTWARSTRKGNTPSSGDTLVILPLFTKLLYCCVSTRVRRKGTAVQREAERRTRIENRLNSPAKRKGACFKSDCSGHGWRWDHQPHHKHQHPICSSQLRN